jgi:hypothetical protein
MTYSIEFSAAFALGSETEDERIDMNLCTVYLRKLAISQRKCLAFFTQCYRGSARIATKFLYFSLT